MVDIHYACMYNRLWLKYFHIMSNSIVFAMQNGQPTDYMESYLTHMDTKINALLENKCQLSFIFFTMSNGHITHCK